MKFRIAFLYVFLLKNALALYAQKQPSPDNRILIRRDYVCSQTENYIPHNPQLTPVKRLRLVVHIFGKDDGSGNLQNTPEERAFIKRIINHVNWFYTETEPMKPASPTYKHIVDSRVRFVVDTILFHRDTESWNFRKYVGTPDSRTKDTVYSNSGGYNRAEGLYRQFVQENDHLNLRQKDSALHIFFVEAKSFEQKGMAESINTKRWVYSIGAYHYYNKGENHWDPGMLLAHEIGHALGLIHPYDYQQCPDLPVTPKGATNNIVDSYPNEGRGMTPCQMGILHYNLGGKAGRVGDIVIRDWCHFLPDTMVRIPAGDTVFFLGQKHFPADVYIEPGAVLVVRCTLSLPKGAGVFVANKGVLIVDGGTLTNLCGDKWNGVQMEKRGRLLGIFKRKSKAVLEIRNDGKIENAENTVSEVKFE